MALRQVLCNSVSCSCTPQDPDEPICASTKAESYVQSQTAFQRLKSATHISELLDLAILNDSGATNSLGGALFVFDLYETFTLSRD